MKPVETDEEFKALIHHFLPYFDGEYEKTWDTIRPPKLLSMAIEEAFTFPERFKPELIEQLRAEARYFYEHGVFCRYDEGGK